MNTHTVLRAVQHLESFYKTPLLPKAEREEAEPMTAEEQKVFDNLSQEKQKCFSVKQRKIDKNEPMFDFSGIKGAGAKLEDLAKKYKEEKELEFKCRAS